ncbi:hypothetical protein BKA93DRAFT_160622 [Sparassis latifolia]
MAETDVLRALCNLLEKEKRYHESLYNKPLTGHLQLFPPKLGVNTDGGHAFNCTVHLREYENYLELVPEGFLSDANEAAQTEDEPWSYLSKPLHQGNVIAKVRGNELFLACGYHGVRMNLGVDACMLRFGNDNLASVSEAISGTSGNVLNRDRIGSFLTSNAFMPRDSNRIPGIDRMNIVAAVNCATFSYVVIDFADSVNISVISLGRHWQESDIDPQSQLWQSIWSPDHGPDWIDEAHAAEQRLLEWRDSILQEIGGISARYPIVYTMCDKKCVFNGFGRRIAHDLLHELGLWPGTPAHLVCQDELYETFRDGIVSYMKQWNSLEFLERVASSPNSTNPLQFGHKAYANYMSCFVHVYHKQKVRVSGAYYNKLYSAGLLDRKHTIGEPYHYDPRKLRNKNDTYLPIFVYSQGGFKIYSVIRARPPREWLFQGGRGDLALDGRHSPCKMSFGYTQVHVQVENMLDSSLAQRGRRRKHQSGRRGRPAKDPKMSELRDQMNVGLAFRKKMLAQLEAERLEDEATDSDQELVTHDVEYGSDCSGVFTNPEANMHDHPSGSSRSYPETRPLQFHVGRAKTRGLSRLKSEGVPVEYESDGLPQGLEDEEDEEAQEDVSFDAESGCLLVRSRSVDSQLQREGEDTPTRLDSASGGLPAQFDFEAVSMNDSSESLTRIAKEDLSVNPQCEDGRARSNTRPLMDAELLLNERGKRRKLA